VGHRAGLKAVVKRKISHYDMIFIQMFKHFPLLRRAMVLRHHRYKRPKLDHIVSQFNPIHISKSKTHFHIIPQLFNKTAARYIVSVSSAKQ